MMFFYKFMKKYKIDLVVTNIKREVIFGGIPAKLIGIPVIRRIGNERDFIGCEKLEPKYVNREIFVCNSTREKALKVYKWLDPERTTVIHTGKKMQEFSAEEILVKRRSWNATSDEIVIGISDRLSEAKGIQILIRTFSDLLNEYKNIRLVITGKGNYEPELKKLVSELKIEHHVHFAGFTTEVMLSAAAYDIAVLSSFFESFPNTVVEYLACGKPVVCTDVGGVKEIVQDNFNGFIIEKENKEQLVSALRKLISDKELRRKFSVNALETIRKGFTEEIMYEKTIKVFRYVAGKN